MICSWPSKERNGDGMTKQDVNVQIMNLPGKQNEIVIENEDGTYTVVIDAQLSNEGRLHAYEHAWKHINNNDFERNNVQHIEVVAHDTQALEEKQFEEKYPNYTRHLRRRRAQRRKRQRDMEKKISFLQENGHDFFGSAEENYLYGRDNI